MNPSRMIETRSDLLKLLSEAAELEHGVACSYLYAGFSLKHDISEGGMSWEEQQQVVNWSKLVYFIASQEMLHLSLVWNLTTSIGGTPYYLRPNFPQSSKYYPLRVPISLEPFGLASLRRFILYEHPESGTPSHNLHGQQDFASNDEGVIEFGSVGELYRLIESGFLNIDPEKLFIGSPTQQMTKDLIDFPDIVAVTDRESAIRAIQEITEQGEGTRSDREDSHFGRFVKMRDELVASSAQGSGFSPARPAMDNPSAGRELGYGANANPIDDPLSSQVAAFFDSVYSLMLRMLAWSFEFDSVGVEAQLKSFCSETINIMTRVLCPLGEGLMRMPAGKKYPGKTAGPAFGLTRHVMLPPNPQNARRLCSERFKELAIIAAGLLKHPLPDSVKNGCQHFQEIAESFSEKTGL